MIRNYYFSWWVFWTSFYFQIPKKRTNYCSIWWEETFVEFEIFTRKRDTKHMNPVSVELLDRYFNPRTRCHRMNVCDTSYRTTVLSFSESCNCGCLWITDLSLLSCMDSLGFDLVATAVFLLFWNIKMCIKNTAYVLNSTVIVLTTYCYVLVFVCRAF